MHKAKDIKEIRDLWRMDKNEPNPYRVYQFVTRVKKEEKSSPAVSMVNSTHSKLYIFEIHKIVMLQSVNKKMSHKTLHKNAKDELCVRYLINLYFSL